jgi:hypothetical protein
MYIHICIYPVQAMTQIDHLGIQHRIYIPVYTHNISIHVLSSIGILGFRNRGGGWRGWFSLATRPPPRSPYIPHIPVPGARDLAPAPPLMQIPGAACGMCHARFGIEWH